MVDTKTWWELKLKENIQKSEFISSCIKHEAPEKDPIYSTFQMTLKIFARYIVFTMANARTLLSICLTRKECEF